MNDGIYIHVYHYDIYTFILECGGKMHLREGEFSRAHTDFFEAFKNYDESGSPRYGLHMQVCSTSTVQL